MKKYVAVLGRQPQISLAELESLFGGVRLVAQSLAEFTSEVEPRIDRLGGTMKIGEKIDSLDSFFGALPTDGKITLGVSDFSRGASAFGAQKEALKLKKQLVKLGRSVRVVPNQQGPIISSATSLHNHLFQANKIELLKHGRDFYRVVQLQNIEKYARRDRERPARDAKVGMLPPKLAQILINLCGSLPEGVRLLDPFCGTGVVLQEAALDGYIPYGTDLNERMIEYTKRNLEWLQSVVRITTLTDQAIVEQGDATNFQWTSPIDAVACETYLGPPMSQPPAEIKLREAKQECRAIILGFLKNLSNQVEAGTPVVVAVPAWLRPDGHYERLNILDEIRELRYNVSSFKNLGQDDLLYHRDRQIVAREIIVLRKK